MARDSEYEWVEVETYIAPPGPYSSKLRVRPVKGGKYDPSIAVECSRQLRKNYPVGTRFRLLCKLTDREGGMPFLYSHFDSPYEVISTPK
jgi:hypothetical protein